MLSLEFLIEDSSGRAMTLGLTQPLTEMSTVMICLAQILRRRPESLTLSWPPGFLVVLSPNSDLFGLQITIKLQESINLYQAPRTG